MSLLLARSVVAQPALPKSVHPVVHLQQRSGTLSSKPTLQRSSSLISQRIRSVQAHSAVPTRSFATEQNTPSNANKGADKAPGEDVWASLAASLERQEKKHARSTELLDDTEGSVVV
jgi:hypothetical protein